MNLAELRTFLTIVETGSLVRAAGVLNVTQSTVTARLKSLEDELGQVLLHRKKSGASLTAAGARLVRYANTISDLWRQVRFETALPAGLDAVCNLASHPDLWPYRGERIFRFIRETQPQVALSVWHGEHQDMSYWLQSGKADLALTYSPSTTAGQVVFDFATDTLILVSTIADSPLKFDPNYVFVEGGDSFGREHAAAYADANTARLSFGTAILGRDYLLEHGGTAYLPRRMAQPYLDCGKFHLLPNAPQFSRRAYVVANETALETWPWFSDALAAVEVEG